MAWTTIARRLGRELARALLDVLCPPACPACGTAAEGLCGGCRALLERRPEPWCERCGEPVVAEGATCGDGHRWMTGIRAARAPLRYRGTGGALVRRLKFEGDLGAARLLARAMADAVGPWLRRHARRAVLVSVPLHRRKLRRRRLDQAALLAELVAARLDLRLAPGALRRVRDTLPQGDPRVTARAANVAGAFAVRRRRPVAGRVVVLVDDTVTSGSTVRECARALRAAGARSVVVLSAVRA